MVITPFELATIEGWKSPDLVREGDFLLGVGSRYTANLNLPPSWSRVQKIQPVRYVNPVYTIPFLHERLTTTQDSEIVSLRMSRREKENVHYARMVPIKFKDFLSKTIVYSLLIANPMYPFSMTEYQLPHDLDKMIDWKVRRLKQSFLWSCWNAKGEEKVSEYPRDSWYYLSRDIFTHILEKAFDIDLSTMGTSAQIRHAKHYTPFLGNLQLLCFYYGYGTELTFTKRDAILNIQQKNTYDYNTQYHQLVKNAMQNTAFHDGIVWSIHFGFRYVVMRIHGVPFFIKSFVEENA